MDNTVVLEKIAREVEAYLGEEDVSKARYQLQMQVANYFVGMFLALVVALFWLPTGFAVDLRNALNANSTWWATWLALLVFLAVDALFSFPLAWYFEFRLENRLGTNRQSFVGWLWDQFKQMALNLLLQSVLFLALYLIFRRWPDYWLPGMVAIVVVFIFVLHLLSPLFVRMQYKSEPLDSPELTERLRALFERAGVRFSGVGVLKFGEKTARSNAAVIPDGVGNKVVISDTLLEKNDPEVIEVVVAHELGHKVHKDLLKQYVAIGTMLIVVLLAAYWVLQTVGRWDGLGGPTDVATFPLLSLVIAWGFGLLQVGLNAFSRRLERAADAYSLRLTGNPEAFERAMLLLAKDNKSFPLPPSWVETLFYSHPSIAKRIYAARRYAPHRSASGGA